MSNCIHDVTPEDCWLCIEEQGRVNHVAALERISALTSELAEARVERDRLRKLFDDAGQGEHNVLALIDHYQDVELAATNAANEMANELAEARRQLRLLDGETRGEPITVLLRLPPQDRPVYFAVSSRRYEPTYDDAHHRYFYEEHTCPTNWLRDVFAIQAGSDSDPHGLFEFVAARDGEAPDDPNEECRYIEEWVKAEDGGPHGAGEAK